MEDLLSRHTLTYRYKELTAPNTWWVLPEGKGDIVRAVIQVTDAAQPRTVEFQVYFRNKHPPKDALFMRPFDGETRIWLVESAQLHADLPRIELQLEQAPPMVGKHFREEL